MRARFTQSSPLTKGKVGTPTNFGPLEAVGEEGGTHFIKRVEDVGSLGAGA